MRITYISNRQEAIDIISKTIKDAAEQLHAENFEICVEDNKFTITFQIGAPDDYIEEVLDQKLTENIVNYEGGDEE